MKFLSVSVWVGLACMTACQFKDGSEADSKTLSEQEFKYKVGEKVQETKYPPLELFMPTFSIDPSGKLIVRQPL